MECLTLCSKHFNDGQVRIIQLIDNKRTIACLGLRTVTEEDIYSERHARMRGEYYDPIERFPDKMDQLLEAFNRVCRRFVSR